ncbi:MAG: hypothetical protein LBH93_00255 [Chitinispirillales bacterium]|jgi:hypothetical protein|nr:hypothetical protein [Chitinispirillales bacterium]
MANIIYVVGKRLLISRSRGSVRGSVIFLLAHLLFLAGIVFAAEVALVLLGTWDIYVPFTAQLMRLLG